ncbi:hypothetical protein M918_04335 [Clostridium sp. BL8]|uniref:glycosyltransferase family 2 protein n=1 Tax=Clostridium sp. BL8 TaxID=1354301 RepID=UPI000389E337|nr:glycosyltransferase family A protein [Clostridium sp. BL8]EQB88375.1 hypothetical protein M918_04335 [Clostridium sp. BL8]
MDIKISVIIPVYNVEKYITKTMESLISQTLKEFELILVDDGSKDSSIELAEGILKGSHINYRVIKKVNEGVSRARNTGIDIAQGTYIYFLDSDDYIEDTLLEKMYHCAQKERAQVVFCGYTHISDEVEHNSNFIKPLLKVHKYLEKPISGIEAAEKMLRNEFWISAISGLYLRSYIKEKKYIF